VLDADGEELAEDPPEDEELHPAATRPAQTIVSTGSRQGRLPRPAAPVPACESIFIRRSSAE
jgi:hypothetical protein